MINEEDLKDPLYWLRWSINSGLVTDRAKDTLYGYAYICHMSVVSADVAIDVDKKSVHYTLFFPKKITRAYNKYSSLMSSEGIINLWRAKRLLKRYGNLEIHGVLKDFVNKLCGPDWSVSLTVRPEEEYVESGGEEA